MPLVEVSVGAPQSSVAVAVPNAALIVAEVGLQPSVVVAPVIVIVGGFTSDVQLTVDAAVELLPHPSIAVQVLV